MIITAETRISKIIPPDMNSPQRRRDRREEEKRREQLDFVHIGIMMLL